MYDKIHCLMFAGARIDDGLRTAMFITACRMIHRHKRKDRFVDENGQGGVSTKFEHHTIGALTGIRFVASVDWKNDTIRCEFLVREKDLPNEEMIMSGYGGWYDAPEDLRGFNDDDDADWWKH